MKHLEITHLVQLKHELQRALIETEAVEVSLLGYRAQTDLLRKSGAHLKAAITALRDVEKGTIHPPVNP